MVAGIFQSSPSAIFHGAAQDLAGAGLGQALTTSTRLEGGDRADLLAHQLDELPSRSRRDARRRP
jgi:hypothetical protein